MIKNNKWMQLSRKNKIKELDSLRKIFNKKRKMK